MTEYTKIYHLRFRVQSEKGTAHHSDTSIGNTEKDAIELLKQKKEYSGLRIIIDDWEEKTFSGHSINREYGTNE